MKRFTTLLATGALALALAGCGDDPKPVADDPGNGETSKGGKPSDKPTEPTEPAETTGAPADTATVPVYFVGDTPQGPRLFREFRRVEADNPLSEAAALLTAGDVQDPDYRTLFPSGHFKDVRFDDATGTIVVEVPDNTWFELPSGMTKAQGRLAVQQLIYTLQGVQQERAPVRVELAGGPAPLFGVDTTEGASAAAELDVLALVNITTPEQGQPVSGSFTAEGVASSFEATVPWEIRQGDQVVKDGFSTATGWVDKLYPWTTEVDVSDLEPGEYTFVAMTDDPSGGEGGGPTEDSKTIIVQ